MKRLPVFLLCAGLMAGKASSSVERAWQLVRGGQRDQAIVLLQQAIKSNSSDADARLLLGSLFMEAGRGAEAILQLSEAVRIRPRSAETQNALGEAYSSIGNFKAAREPFEKAVALKPDFGVAQMNLGEALLNVGDLDRAASHFDRATKLLGDSDDAANVHYLRAKVFTARDDAPHAADQLQQATAIRPGFSQAWSDLGQARKTALDDAGALAAFERAVQLAPDDSVAQYRLGAEYLDSEKAGLAVEHFQIAYKLNPQDQSTLNALQKALRQEGRTKEADDVKEKLAGLLRKKDEDSQNALAATNLNNEGAVLQKAGDLQGALTKYRAALALAPESVPLRVNYGVALLRLGKWKEGLEELHTAQQKDPANADIQEALKEALAQAPAGTVPDWNRR